MKAIDRTLRLQLGAYQAPFPLKWPEKWCRNTEATVGHLYGNIYEFIAGRKKEKYSWGQR